MKLEGYDIKVVGWFGDYTDTVVVFEVKAPSGKISRETRVGSATKKGVFRTSIYGIKIKVDLSSNEIYSN